MKTNVMIEPNAGGNGKLLTAYVEMQSGEHKALGAQHIKAVTLQQVFEVGDQVRLKPEVLDQITAQAKRRGVVLALCGDWVEVRLEDVGEGVVYINSSCLELDDRGAAYLYVGKSRQISRASGLPCSGCIPGMYYTPPFKVGDWVRLQEGTCTVNAGSAGLVVKVLSFNTVRVLVDLTEYDWPTKYCDRCTLPFKVGDWVRTKPAGELGRVQDLSSGGLHILIPSQEKSVRRDFSEVEPEPRPFPVGSWVRHNLSREIGRVRDTCDWAVLVEDQTQTLSMVAVQKLWPYEHKFDEGQLVTVVEDEVIRHSPFSRTVVLHKGDVGRVIHPADRDESQVLVDVAGLNNPEVYKDGKWCTDRTNLVRYVPQWTDQPKVDVRTGLINKVG